MAESSTTVDTFNKVFFGSDDFDFVWTPVHWAAIGTTAVLAWPHLKKFINKASGPSATPKSARSAQRAATRAPKRSVTEGVEYDD